MITLTLGMRKLRFREARTLEQSIELGCKPRPPGWRVCALSSPHPTHAPAD